MQDLVVGGMRVMTTDGVANALLDLAATLASLREATIVEFPAIVEGRVAQVKMLLGAGIPLVAVPVEPELPLEVAGAEAAAWEIRQRTAALT